MSKNKKTKQLEEDLARAFYNNGVDLSTGIPDFILAEYCVESVTMLSLNARRIRKHNNGFNVPQTTNCNHRAK